MTPLVLGVSPYHLTGPAPAAMAALLLGDAVVTLVPTPPGAPDRARARLAAQAIPRFVELVDRWKWSVPLWLDGVLSATHAGEDPAAHVHAVMHEIATRDELAPLRPYLDHRLDADDSLWLDAVASDLLRGGPDPGLVVPVVAAMDRLCARTGVLCVRPDPRSLAEQAEARMARRLGRIAMPALIECSGDRLLEAREELSDELADLRAALRDGADARPASDRLTSAFQALREQLTRPDPEVTDPRVRVATVSIETVELPAEPALRSSVAAARVAVSAGAAPASTSAFPEAPGCRAVVVRVVGRPAAIA